ncbi:unnamed protein product [Miscanthus lutarioriparius]|uniref:Uncharacterized protein n=1 Tax=Miscanthus lutarioriparius TaxID=422564 RepID=A0A811P6Y8_9POAL|nr:unnamed protein product [Miscanthus lutarioriparius]
MRWNNNTSGFVLRRMAQLVFDGSRADKCFKDKDVNYVAKALLDYYGEADINAIMLEPEHYTAHCKDHPKNAEFLNTPIKFYTEMETIFGSSMATSSVAAKIEAQGFTTAVDIKYSPDMGEGSKATELLTSNVGVKRKRGNFSEEEMLMMTNMTDAVNNVASTLRETRPAHVDPDLYLVVMEMPGFTTEALIVIYTYLLENKALGRGFVNMAISHTDIWLRNYLAKNYYM